MRMRTALLGITLLLASAALGQDLLAVAPAAAKVEYEDAHVRVVRLRLAPHEELPMHDRPSRVVIPLTANDVRTTGPDGASSVVRAPAGKPAWSGPARRSVTNLDQPLENVIVELKDAAAPARPLPRPPSPLPAGYLDEPFHQWAFENQYVRVYDVRIPPGKTTAFHLHALDSVFIYVSGGTTAAQLQGQSWSKTETGAPGTVQFSADALHPRTHRVRNLGPSDFHVIVVQLLHP